MAREYTKNGGYKNEGINSKAQTPQTMKAGMAKRMNLGIN
jgi:hypothetical protein